MTRTFLSSLAFVLASTSFLTPARAQTAPADEQAVITDETRPADKPAESFDQKIVEVLEAPADAPAAETKDPTTVKATKPEARVNVNSLVLAADPAEIVITLRSADPAALARALDALVAKDPVAKKAGITVKADAGAVTVRGEESQRAVINALIASVVGHELSRNTEYYKVRDALLQHEAAIKRKTEAHALAMEARLRRDQQALRATGQLIESTRTNDYTRLVTTFGHNDPHKPLMSAEACRTCHVPPPAKTQATEELAYRLSHLRLDQLDQPWIGVSVGPVDAVLRGQLKLPDGMGVVITQVVEDGPAALGNVQQHDILLSINDQPVAAGEDLDKIVKASAAKSPLKMRLVRGGKNVELTIKTVRPVDGYLERVIPKEMISRYRIGVSIATPDATLRKQLNLADDAGVVVLEVNAGGVAAKAGLRSGDLLLGAGGKPLKGTEDLTQRVQQSEGKPLVFDVLRSGTPVKITVAAVREADAEMRRRVYLDLLGTLPPANDLRSEASHAFLVTGTGAISGDTPAQIQLFSDDLKGHVIDAGRGVENKVKVKLTHEPAAPADLAGQLQRISESLDQLRGSLDALRAGIEKEKSGK